MIDQVHLEVQDNHDHDTSLIQKTIKFSVEIHFFLLVKLFDEYAIDYILNFHHPFSDLKREINMNRVQSNMNY
jgi:hypothetical protein